MKENNREQDDALLSAWLDNELSPPEADVVTERLAREPQLVQRLEAMRGTDDSVRKLYAKVDDLPMPQAVLDLLDDSGKQAERNNVIAFPRRFIERFAQMPVAIAASVALAAGFFVDRMLDEVPEAQSGLSALQAHTVPTNSNVYELLETGSSSTSVTLTDGSTGRVALTFENSAGDWCRQLEIENESTAAQALACRRNGRWENELIVFGEPAGGTYQQASSTTDPMIAAAVDQLIGDGEPLDRQQESEVIGNRWKKLP